MLQKLNEISKGKNMMWNKVIAVMLVITLTFANFILLGVVAGKGAISYAADNLEAQTNSTQHSNVKFDAYFIKDGSKAHTLMLDASETSKLYFALNVRNNGYLKNASIELNNNNYSIAAQLQASEIMEKIEENKIILKQINYGTEAIVDLPILLEINNEFEKNNVNKQSSLILRGTYVTKDGKEVEIEKEIKISLGWTDSTNVKLVSDISKYMVNDEQKEIFLQEKVELNKEEKSLPLQKTILEIEVPRYNSILPEKINVIVNELGLTTGKQNENIEFSDENWKYDNQTGKLTIEVENKELNGIVWAGIGKDEFAINYIYGEEAYNAKQEQNEVKTNVLAKVYNYSGKEIKENIITSEQTKVLSEEIGNVITGYTEIEQNILKGNMYANCNSNNRAYETKYNVKQIIEISYLNKTESIKMEELPEQFLDENGDKNSTKIGGLNYTYYEKTLIDVDNFNKILGQDGYITIADNAGNEIGRIDANTKQEEGNYVISYEEKQDSIILKTSTPIAEGNLIINHKKAIKADLPYTRNQIVAFKQLQANTSLTNNQEEVVLSGASELKETSTKVDMSINKQTITSEKENVEIKLELNNTNDQSDLFVNPKFIIELPKNIITAKIEKAEVLFDDELKVKNYTVNTNEKGNKQLEINLTGTQTKYNTVPNTNGTTINIQAKLGASQTQQGTAILKVENGNSIQYSPDAVTNVTLNSYIATYLDITVDNIGTSVITVEENEEKEINVKGETIKTESLAENATQEQESKEENEQYLKMIVKSNTEENSVLKAGEKYVYKINLFNETPAELGKAPKWTEEDTAKETELKSKIEELEKLSDLTDEQTAELNNLWVELSTLYTKYAAGEQKEYNELMKEKLEKSNKLAEQIEEYMKLKETTVLTEEQSKRLEELQNIVGTIVTLIEEIETLSKNEPLTDEQEQRIKELSEELNEKTELLTLLTEKQEQRLSELEKKIEDGTISNEDDVTIRNVKLEVNLPKYIKYTSTKITNDIGESLEGKEFKYDDKNNTLILELDEYPQNDMLILEIETTVQKLGQEYKKQLESIINLEYEQQNRKEKIQEQQKLTIGKMEIELIKTIEGLKEINKVGDEITFKLKINNIGGISCSTINGIFKLPDGLNFRKMQYGINDSKYELSNQNVKITEEGIIVPIADINAGDSIYVYVTAVIENTENENLEASASIKYRENIEDDFQEQKALWNINVIDEINNSDNPNEEEENLGEEQSTTYSISGIAWIDENPDGIKSENEKGLPQTKVMLVDVSTNKTIQTLTTDENGQYEFTNINSGEFQVIFEYNQKEYSLTEYKKTSEEEVNSDAIKVEEGIAITDVIKLSNKNIRNINIGLINIPKLDFKLEKRVSKITVQNKQETKTYNFNEVEIAKVEVDSKYINGTVVMIEYTIKVTNEGDVAGTIEKIVDYTPSNMVFSSDLNSSWIQDNSGNLYNTELSQISIEPGETKQISLVLRKNMTEFNTGTINNRAEIVELSNKENLKDQDSIPNNKAQNEDDLSMANVIIGIKTGSVALYVFLIISSLILLAVGIYFIRKI